MLEALIVLAVVLLVVAVGVGLVLYALVPRTDPKLAELERGRAPLATSSFETADPVEAATREAAALMKQGKKIEAVKVFREKTGVSLAEAKAAVERL